MAHTKDSLKSELKLYNGYYHWLLEMVMFKEMKRSGRSYIHLLKAMHQKAFTVEVDNDVNRAMDGKNLRIMYRDISGMPGDQIKGGCTFLEMCVALANRITGDIFEHDPNYNPARWFWEMMENCGLDKYTDDNFDELMVRKIMDRIIRRHYSKTGKGGLFPLKHPKKDQREVEIWYQMQSYVTENFGY